LSRGNRSQPGHERTDEERERDRLEREQRRAGRSGSALPDAAPDVTEQHDLLDDEPVEHDLPDDEPSAHEPRDDDEAHEHHDEGFHDDEPDADEREPLDSGAVASQTPRFIPADPYAELDPVPQERPSRALAVGANAGVVARSEKRGGGRRGGRDGRAAGTGVDGAGGGERASGGRRFTRARVAALFALAVAIALVWFLLSLFQPLAGGGTGRVIVQIPKGSSSSKIGSILARDHVVSSGFFFNIRALLEGKRSSLHSGRFQLKREMSYSAAIEALSKPPPKVIVVKVVIPEGYTRRQIADLVGEDALSGSYLAATVHSRLLNPKHYGAPSGTSNLEGFLFPATYELTAGAPTQRLVDDQLKTFRERFSAEDMRRARELHVTPYQLLTVASMIEREAQTEHDRPRIAAVIYNRLHEGIPLGIDATIYYAVERQKGIATYTGELTESQLKIDSPYNSRTHKGLPPTPISNPGEASIDAAAHPSHVPYLYYVAGADGCGEQVFSKTNAEFEKNVAAYDAAVKKNGGHPPACKKK
jgi:peptidoglycan lytic transglycosylase G